MLQPGNRVRIGRLRGSPSALARECYEGHKGTVQSVAESDPFGLTLVVELDDQRLIRFAPEEVEEIKEEVAEGQAHSEDSTNPDSVAPKPPSPSLALSPGWARQSVPAAFQVGAERRRRVWPPEPDEAEAMLTLKTEDGEEEEWEDVPAVEAENSKEAATGS